MIEAEWEGVKGRAEEDGKYRKNPGLGHALGGGDLKYIEKQTVFAY